MGASRYQTDIRAALMQAEGLPEDAFEIVPIRTSGDRIQDRAHVEAGGTALVDARVAPGYAPSMASALTREPKHTEAA